MESKFLLNSKNIKKLKYTNNEKNTDNDLILTGIASTTREASLYGEVMTVEALNQMCEQAVGLPILEGHKGDSFDTVIGVILDAYILEDDLHIDFKILSNHQERINELLANGVPIGLSIGAQALIDEATSMVTSVRLVEVSLTPVPANRVAHNTVHVKEDYYTGECLYGICNAMIKDKIEVNNMTEKEEEKTIDLEESTELLEESIEEEPVPEKEEETEDGDDTIVTIEKVKELLDERFNEEKEVLIETVVEEVLTKLDKKETTSNTITESIKEEDEPVVTVEAQSETNTKESAPKINEEEIIDSLTEKILNSLGEKRTVTGTKTETVLKEKYHEDEEGDKPFTSEEAAKLIINDMNKKDPLARAINDAIKQ